MTKLKGPIIEMYPVHSINLAAFLVSDGFEPQMITPARSGQVEYSFTSSAGLIEAILSYERGSVRARSLFETRDRLSREAETISRRGKAWKNS